MAVSAYFTSEQMLPFAFAFACYDKLVYLIIFVVALVGFTLNCIIDWAFTNIRNT